MGTFYLKHSSEVRLCVFCLHFLLLTVFFLSISVKTPFTQLQLLMWPQLLWDSLFKYSCLCWGDGHVVVVWEGKKRLFELTEISCVSGKMAQFKQKQNWRPEKLQFLRWGQMGCSGRGVASLLYGERVLCARRSFLRSVKGKWKWGL